MRSRARNQHQRGVDRVLGTRPADQYPGRASRPVIDRADIDAPKQSRQPRLATLRVTPHLGYDDRVAAKLHAVPLRRAQPSDQHPVIALRRHERAGVENKCAHAPGSAARSPSSRSACSSSAAVKAPCSSVP
jgi:hypothetical protein